MRAAPDRSLLWIAVAAIVGLALVILMGGIMIGVMANGHVCCRRGGGSDADQTPFVTSAIEVTVDIRDFDFSPSDLTIDQGATVTWVNHDTAPHDAVQDEGAWKTDLLQKDDRGAVTFDEPDAFPYHCSLHSYMTGTVTVLAR